LQYDTVSYERFYFHQVVQYLHEWSSNKLVEFHLGKLLSRLIVLQSSAYFPFATTAAPSLDMHSNINLGNATGQEQHVQDHISHFGTYSLLANLLLRCTEELACTEKIESQDVQDQSVIRFLALYHNSFVSVCVYFSKKVCGISDRTIQTIVIFVDSRLQQY
jgi:hypothetical protein